MNKLDYSGLSKLTVGLAILSWCFLENGMYVSLGLLVLLGIVHLTFKKNVVNVFTFLMLFHLVQIICYIFYVNASWEGNLNLLTQSSVKAYLSALTGVLVMCFVFSVTALDKLSVSMEHLSAAAARINPKRAVYLFFILYSISTIAGAAAFSMPSLTQVLINLALLKWVGFVLLGYLSFFRRELRVLFLLAFVFDFVGGFVSYFSSFKLVFFYTAVVLMTFTTSIKLKTSLKALAVAAFLFSLAVVWTVVKGEYRSFLNGGSNKQVVNVSKNAAYNKLSDLVGNVTKEDLNNGIGELFYRVQYVYHLAKTMDNVPSKEPHENGALWAKTIRFTIVPRFLNPDKGISDASLKASKYTGIQFLGYNQGVSFSLGYFADCYIDFGLLGMFLALAAIAFLWSKIFLFFLFKSSNNLLLNYAVVAAYFVQFYTFEMDGTFMFGRMFTTFVFFLLLKYTIFPLIERYISYKDKPMIVPTKSL